MVVPAAFSFEELHDFVGLAGMEIAGGLVSKDELRLRDDRTGDADKLLLATGKLTRVEVLFSNDREAIERIGDEGGPLRFAVTTVGEGDVEIFVNRQVVEQIVI